MSMISRQLPSMLTEAEASEMLGCSTRTLQSWRASGQGPRFVKLNGSMVRYPLKSIEDFIAGGERGPVAEGRK
ncbi:helix-turn-helix domain-containing protein [Rhodoblastus sp.]|uniref:helix-turn-helix transcriptional regulator n=1 Tax=Rhodoblastus sp. TaxID=1962975 RepID=UPI002612DF91|nr:helix-turn-helix domain-containing protein [Rhodoblastus sp.]